MSVSHALEAYRRRGVVYEVCRSVWLDAQMVADIDRTARELKIGRAEALRTLIQWGIDSGDERR